MFILFNDISIVRYWNICLKYPLLLYKMSFSFWNIVIKTFLDKSSAKIDGNKSVHMAFLSIHHDIHLCLSAFITSLLGCTTNLVAMLYNSVYFNYCSLKGFRKLRKKIPENQLRCIVARWLSLSANAIR